MPNLPASPDHDESDARRVLRFLESYADEDVSTATVAERLHLDPAEVDSIVSHLLAFRGEAMQPREGFVRWSPFDDRFDRRLAARDHAEEIVRLLT